MKTWQTLVLSSLIASSLAACSSSDDDSGGASGIADDVGATTGVADATTGDLVTGTTTGAATAGGTTGTVDDDPDTGGTATAGTTDGDDDGGVNGNDGGEDDGGTTGGDDGGTATGGGSASVDGLPIPDLENVYADVPDGDPFGFTLENDPEPSIGGIPTQPKNLRIDLVSNDWAEFSWAPSNDDTGVVRYDIQRDDGVVYSISSALPAGLSFDPGTYEEYAKYFTTTSFIDCNQTRFAFAPGSEKAADAESAAWNCADTRPTPGEAYTYTVTAVDAAGNASQASEPLTIRYASTDADDRTRVADFLGAFDEVWSDEFDGAAVDPEKWQTTLVFGSDQFINGEQQYFVPTLEGAPIDYDPFEFTDEGTLKINARRTSAAELAQLPASCAETDPILQLSDDREHCEFLSGALSSHDRMQFVYGYVEGRINASTISGALSSFYLYHRYAGNNDAEQERYFLHGPEIDILEYLGENPFGDEDAFQTYHFIDPNTGIIRSSPTMNHEREDGDIYGDEFHTFGVLWEPNLAVWYIDGVEIRRIEGPQLSAQPMNVINYLVTGSGWAPEPADGELGPITMEVDYIRVYQREQFQSSLFCGVPGGVQADCPEVD